MSTKSLKILFLSALLILLLAACSGGSSEQSSNITQPESNTGQTGEVSFSTDVLPIFKNSCTRCHGNNRQNGELRLDSYAALMEGGKDGAAIVPNNAAGSLLVELISNGKMPRNSAPLPEDKITLISEWINAGAKDN